MRALAGHALMLGVLGAGSGVARAAPLVSIPTDAESLSAALLEVDAGGTIVIEETAAAHDDGCVLIDKDLTIRGEGDRPRISGLNVSGGTLTLENLTLAGSCTVMLSYAGSQRTTARLNASDGSIVATNLTIEASDLPGMVLHNRSNVFSGLVAQGNTTWPALVVETNTGSLSLTLHEANFTGNTGGSIRVQGNPDVFYDLTVSIQGSTFNANYGPDVADIYAFYADVQVSDSTFVGTGFEDLGQLIPQEAGFILLHNANLSVTDTSFSESRSLYAGAIAALEQDTGRAVSLSGVYASRCAASEGYGGLLFAYGGDVELRNVRANQLFADYGALVKVWPGRNVTLEDVAISNFEVGAEGAVFLESVESAQVRRLRVCGGRSSSGGGNVGLYALSVPLAEVSNSVFHDLDSPSGHAVLAQWSTLYLHNNTFAGNTVGSLLVGDASALSVLNNIFAMSPGAIGLNSWSSNAVSFGGYNLYYSLSSSQANMADALDAANDLNEVNPNFWQHWSETDCTSFPLLDPSSLAIDAGYPDAAFNDPDGSRSDIGAFGGPDAVFPDEDGDGTALPDDCDDRDSEVSPDRAEIPGDGIDNDCDESTPDLSGEDTGQPNLSYSARGGCAGCAGAPLHAEIKSALVLLFALARRRLR